MDALTTGTDCVGGCGRKLTPTEEAYCTFCDQNCQNHPWLPFRHCFMCNPKWQYR